MIKVHDLYTARDFSIKEFVPQGIYKAFGEHSINFINSKLIIAAQELRNDMGVPIYINTWPWGGGLNYRGYRPPFARVGSPLSQHKFGQAIDVSSSVPHYKIYEKVMELEKKYFELGIRRMENPQYTKGNHLGWVHVDTKDVGMDKIHIFNP